MKACWIMTEKDERLPSLLGIVNKQRLNGGAMNHWHRTKETKESSSFLLRWASRFSISPLLVTLMVSSQLSLTLAQPSRTLSNLPRQFLSSFPVGLLSKSSLSSPQFLPFLWSLSLWPRFFFPPSLCPLGRFLFFCLCFSLPLCWFSPLALFFFPGFQVF